MLCQPVCWWGGLYRGIALIIEEPSALTIAAGIGLIGLSVLFLVFLVRFAFAKYRNHNPNRVEVTEEDQPRLYAFIKQLAEDTHAPLPRRVFLVPDVSTAVFYHASFWNVFWPVRKNLEIGLGLVNSVSIGEFKAVLAHELGFFSSPSLSLKSYLYTVNRILYNLVYDYDPWDRLLDQWVAAGGILGFFAIVVRGMINTTHTLLRGAYGIVHHYYLGMSQEMVYRADLVATRVAGHEAMISALRRIELSTQAYDQCSDYLNQLAERGKKTDDIYANHRGVLLRLTHRYQLTLQHGLPRIPDGELAKNVVRSRINVKDQWASHPSRREREQSILLSPVVAEAYPQSARKLFRNFSLLRRAVTSTLYEVGFPSQSFESISSDDFVHYVEETEGKYCVSSAFQGFYDRRFLQPFDPEKVVASGKRSDHLTFEMVYNEAHCKKIARCYVNQDDFELLKQIQGGSLLTRYFEFDHKKRSLKDVGGLIRRLNSDLARQERWLAELDQQAFLWHYQQAQRAGVSSEYLNRYQSLMSLQKAYQSFSENRHQIDYWRGQLLAQSHGTEPETSELAKELANVEVSFKSQLRTCAAVDRIVENLTESLHHELVPYLRSEQAYYLRVSEFDQEALDHFAALVLDVWTAARGAYKQSLKSLTDYQLGLHVTAEPVAEGSASSATYPATLS